MVVELQPRRARRFGLFVLILALTFVTASCAFRTISTGHVGVTTLFGKVTGERLDEGIHLLNPLKRVAEMSVRTQEVKEQAAVPSSEGLIMRLEASLLFRVDPATRAGGLPHDRSGLCASDHHAQFPIGDAGDYRRAYGEHAVQRGPRHRRAADARADAASRSRRAESWSRTCCSATSSFPTRCVRPSKPSSRRIRRRSG